MPQKDPEKIKKEIDKLKREYHKFAGKISQLKKEQNRLVKKIMAKSDHKRITQIKKELNK